MNIYETLANKAAVTEEYLRAVADYEIEDIENAVTDDEFADACSHAIEHINIVIWELVRVRDAVSQLNRNDFEK